jgi:GAF domain-containing protein
LNYLGRSEAPCRLQGEAFDEEAAWPQLLAEKDTFALYDICVHRAWLCYHFEAYDETVNNLAASEKYLEGLGVIDTSPNNMFESLARIGLCSQALGDEKRRHLRRARSNQKKMKKWVKHAPMNHQHRYELVAAELARIKGHHTQAMDFYDQAIAHARAHLYLREEALANELAAKFYLAREQVKIAKAYLREARFLYQKWGALALVQHLDRKYAGLLHEAITAAPAVETTTLAGTSTSTVSATGALDWLSVLKASQALSSEIDLEKLLQKMIKIVIENAGAQRGVLLFEKEGHWHIEAEGAAEREAAVVLKSLPMEVNGRHELPSAIVHFVSRTHETVVLSDAGKEGRFTNDPYVRQCASKSILCMPVLKQAELLGILYLENNLIANAFVPNRLEALEILSSQFAVSLENARLYHETKRLNANLEQAAKALEEYSRTLEEKVDQRTAELTEKNEALTQALSRLQDTQRQLVLQEKMASLGQLTAGIAHEIKNPLNFVNNFAVLSVDLAKELREKIAKIVDRGSKLVDQEDLGTIKEILGTLIQNAEKITEHGKRADGIVRSMMQHSRGRTGERELTDINALVDQALNLTYHGLRAQYTSFHVTIEKNYDETVGQLSVLPQDLSRVFLNLINNACYAAFQKREANGQEQTAGKSFSPTLSVRTRNRGEIQVETEEGQFTEFMIRLPKN